MDRLTFLKEYKLSRGQLDRKIAKAGKGGVFEIPGYGKFRATKQGKSKTSPLDIVPLPAEEENTAAETETVPENTAPTPAKKTRRKTHAELSRMTIQELEKEKKIVEIQKLDQQADEGRKLIREEAINELIPAFTEIVLKLREKFVELNLSDAQLKTLSAIIDAAIEEVGSHA